MNFLLFLFTVFLLSVSSLAFSQAVGYGGSGGVGFGGDGGYATSNSTGGAGGNSSSISQGGNGFGGAGGLGGSGGDGGMGGHGGNGNGGLGGAGGIGTGTGGNASNAGNAQSFHIDQVRQSPAVFMGAPMPTAVCQATMGGFLSFIGGAGFAASRTLQECEKREASRTAYGIGQAQMALEIMCMTEYGSRTSACRGISNAWDD